MKNRVKEEDVNWIVNDLGELGVEIQGQCFFLYKGRSLQYSGMLVEGSVCLHEDNTPMKYRQIGEYEFGETCWPLEWTTRGHRSPRYTQDIKLSNRASASLFAEYAWKPLPAPSKDQETTPVEANAEQPVSTGVEKVVPSTLVDKVARRMQEVGMTVAVLARELGVSERKVRSWLSGDKDMRVGKLHAMCEAVGLTLSLDLD